MQVRKARLHDASNVYDLVNSLSGDGTLLKRPFAEICENIRDFVVVEQQGDGTGGALGDRVHVNVDYDTQREFTANNNINVYYQGLEDEILVTASNRAGQLYLRPGVGMDVAALARRLDGDASVETTLWREGAEAVARREGEELRFRPGTSDGWETSGDASLLDHPDALNRAWAALANPNAGELLVSAAEGWELADLGGRHHAGGGSHGSLVAGDTLVPLVTVGIKAEVHRITDVAPAVLAYFGVRVPESMEAGSRVSIM